MPEPQDGAIQENKDDVKASPDGDDDEKKKKSQAGSEADTSVPNSDDENEETGSQVGQPAEEGNVLNDDALSLQEELNKIVIIAPPMNVQPSEIFDPSEFPISYKENSPKEKLVLAFGENFRRQYVHLYRDKKPLFLNPYNECGVDKFVCTTIRKTQLKYEELYDWTGTAEFVADYLDFVPLEPPFEMPKRLLSPTTVLKQQKGNCFEYSTLLCSLLIGAGYDAYVVSGYADRETCLMDEIREICPLLKKKEEIRDAELKKQLKKYTVRPPRDLRSKFELMLEERQRKEEEEEDLRMKKEREAMEANLERPPTDPLYGLRVHSWVLVLEGKRQVAESFFIEPFTGISHDLKSVKYQGIESIWNHQNYWVNMQDCSNGVIKMNYDLADCTQWEFMFPGFDKTLVRLPEDEDLIDEDEEDNDVERYLDMPPAWILPISISLKDYQTRCPMGKKTKLYKRAKLEKMAPYLMRDGLVSRLSIYQDRELTNLVQSKEYYRNRVDQLIEKLFTIGTGLVVETYTPGRPTCLKEHKYMASSPGPESERTMTFYHEARIDGLEIREEQPTEMTEHFKNRDDFLYYRFVEFGKRTKKFGPADSVNTRPIIKMLERFHRNPDNIANEDMAEITYLVSEEKIQVIYHTDEARITVSTREFMKPPNADEKGAILLMTPDMHTTYQVDQDNYKKKNVELYQLMVELIGSEERCKNNIRMSELEVEEILSDRAKEEIASELEISVYDTMRNEKAKKHRLELERHIMEEKLRKQEMELDYLAPFLAQMGNPEKFNRQDAFKLKEDCLSDLKQRLIDKANLIQARFEVETQNLQKKQAWYQQNQVSMQKDDEEDYLNYCSEAMFRIHILEVRLNRHRDMAPHKYMELEKKLRLDHRMADYF